MAENGDTLLEVRKKFDYLIYDKEAIAVLDEHIKRGFGDWIYKDFAFWRCSDGLETQNTTTQSSHGVPQ